MKNDSKKLNKIKLKIEKIKQQLKLKRKRKPRYFNIYIYYL